MKLTEREIEVPTINGYRVSIENYKDALQSAN